MGLQDTGFLLRSFTALENRCLYRAGVRARVSEPLMGLKGTEIKGMQTRSRPPAGPGAALPGPWGPTWDPRCSAPHICRGNSFPNPLSLRRGAQGRCRWFIPLSALGIPNEQGGWGRGVLQM